MDICVEEYGYIAKIAVSRQGNQCLRNWKRIVDIAALSKGDRMKYDESIKITATTWRWRLMPRNGKKGA